MQSKNAQLASAEDIRDVITELLSECNIPYCRTPYDRDLHDLCLQECNLKRYPIYQVQGKASISKYIPSGVIIASTGCAHLKNRSTQVFIAIYSAFVTWIDDTYTQDVIGVDNFNERFMAGQQQANEGLDGFARLLREINLYYQGIQANLILTASLNFVTSIILDFETQGMTVPPHAKSYATFLRNMSGIGEAYTIFTFSSEISPCFFGSAIDDIHPTHYSISDVLSFYKEELAGENGNYIFNEASQRGLGEKKIPVFKELAHDVVLYISRVTNILEGEGKAAIQSFISGYVSFHISFNSRYHLDDLFLSQ